MNRIKIIQKLINKVRAKTYLEIGVAGGNCFLKIRAPTKIGVDPEFSIEKDDKKVIKILKNKYNFSNKYFNMTSDEFFKTKAENLLISGLDIVFIDGFHSYEQSLKDVQNSLKYLKKKGFIILHDCNPINKKIATPFKERDGVGGLWSGDVWKTIVHLRSTHKDLNIFVVDCDFGVEIILLDEPDDILEYSQNDLDNLCYEDLEMNRKNLLNLKTAKEFKKFVKSASI